MVQLVVGVYKFVAGVLNITWFEEKKSINHLGCLKLIFKIILFAQTQILQLFLQQITLIKLILDITFIQQRPKINIKIAIFKFKFTYLLTYLTID
jgi:hypothetical protein